MLKKMALLVVFVYFISIVTGPACAQDDWGQQKIDFTIVNNDKSKLDEQGKIVFLVSAPGGVRKGDVFNIAVIAYKVGERSVEWEGGPTISTSPKGETSYSYGYDEVLKSKIIPVDNRNIKISLSSEFEIVDSSPNINSKGEREYKIKALQDTDSGYFHITLYGNYGEPYSVAKSILVAHKYSYPNYTGQNSYEKIEIKEKDNIILAAYSPILDLGISSDNLPFEVLSGSEFDLILEIYQRTESGIQSIDANKVRLEKDGFGLVNKSDNNNKINMKIKSPATVGEKNMVLNIYDFSGKEIKFEIPIKVTSRAFGVTRDIVFVVGAIIVGGIISSYLLFPH